MSSILSGKNILVRRDPPSSPNKTRDRCCDLKNIFAEKFSENFGVLCSNFCEFLRKFNHNNSFCEKTPIFSPKIVKNGRKLLK
jgi:hypothetical protein